MSELVEIDHGHDSFTVTREAGSVQIELWSRGSFTVNIQLSDSDARSFGEALIRAANGAPDAP